MAPLLTAVTVASLIGLIVYKYVLVPGFLSPLSKVPTAHPLCSITPRWFAYQRKKLQELKTLYKAHQKHGPVVRLGPQEVSVVSREGLRQVYTAGLEKDPWYATAGIFTNYETPNLVSTLDHKTHSAEKRMISHLYAKSFIQYSPDIEALSRRLIFDRLLPTLDRFAKHEEDVNVLDLFQWTGIDFMSAYEFGNAHSTDFLRDQEGRDRYFAEWTQVKTADDFIGEKAVMEGVIMTMCQKVLAAQSRNEQPDGTRPILFSRLYSEMSDASKSKGSQLSQENVLKRCASEMLDHIIAAHETTGTTLTYAAYHLTLNPALQKALRSELRTLQPIISISQPDSVDSELPQTTSIDRLPLLDAVINETLRLNSPAPCRQPRMVPEGGIYLHGFHIPAGTTVSCNAYCLHRHDAAFPQPFEWIPQRWLSTMSGDAAKEDKIGSLGVEEMRKWFWAFGSGGRMCIGSNFALQGKHLSFSMLSRMVKERCAYFS